MRLSTRFLFAVILSVMLPAAVQAGWELGIQELVQAGGVDIDVDTYSAPSTVDWNNDGSWDLLVGEKTNYPYKGKVRVYLNTGTSSAPAFDGGYSYVQSDGADMELGASGCLGAFARSFHWDGDGRKDLIVGDGYGQVRIFLNIGTDDNPTFDSGAYVQAGPAGSKTNIDVGDRATPKMIDWDGNGLDDLLCGAYDGKLHLFLNMGTDTAPDFQAETLIQYGSADLLVPSLRSSPEVADLNGDGLLDLLSGNTNGQLVYYENHGTDTAPLFDSMEYVTYLGASMNRQPIDLPVTRSRVALQDYTGDGSLDMLLGASDGKLYLYQAVPEPGCLSALAALGIACLFIRRRIF